MSTHRRRRRLILSALSVILLTWLVVCSALLYSARSDAIAGAGTLDDVELLYAPSLASLLRQISDVDVADDTAAQLDQVSDDFASANAATTSPVLAPLRVLPVLGRQLRSMDALSAAASDATATAADSLVELTDTLEISESDPAGRVETIDRASETLDSLLSDLESLDLGPDEGLVGPLADAYDDFAERRDRLLSMMDDASVAARGVSDFLTGPTTYLVVAANNAEMRAGAGMPLQLTTMTVDGGAFRLGELEAAADIVLDAPGAELDADVEALWGSLDPNRDWRNVNLTARFDESARLAAQMWEASGRGHVDGVMSIDVVALERLLTMVGPVTITDDEGVPTEISADNVEQQLLVDQYIDFDGADDDRRARLGEVATAVFDAFNTGGTSPLELFRVMQRSGSGRNLMLWSEVPDQQRAWEVLGASGRIYSDDMVLSVLNRGGNKLDPFVAVDAALSSTLDGDRRAVEVTVTLTNTAPTGLPRYIVGPFPGTDLNEGDYYGLVTLAVPGAASAELSATGQGLLGSGPDGASRVMVSRVVVPRGETTSVTFGFDLPASTEEVRVQSSARVPAVNWTAGDTTWTDDRQTTVDLTST